MKQSISWTLLLLAALLWLSLVCADDSRLPSGETVEQWLWFDRMALWAVACTVIGLWLGRKGACPDLSGCVSWALIAWAGVQAVWGLRQLYGFAASGHALYALTGSFFNPGPYSGYLALALPICCHEYLRQETRWLRYAAGGCALLILCVLPAGMSRSAWLAAGVSCLWVYGCRAGWAASSGLYGGQSGGRCCGWRPEPCAWHVWRARVCSC